MGYGKLFGMISEVISSAVSKDGKVSLSEGKIVSLVIASLITILTYVVTEFFAVYETANNYKWQVHYMEQELERVQQRCDIVVDTNRASVDTTPVKNSSYEHPSVPTNPTPERRELPKAVTRDRVEDIINRING